MKKRHLTLFTAFAAAAAFASSAQAATTLMAPTVNNGSFEDWTGSGYKTNPAVIDHAPWSFTTNNGGLWKGGSADTDGTIGIQVNAGTNTEFARATTIDLLTAGDSFAAYSTVTVGDVFTYDLDYWLVAGTAKTISYSVDFGNGPVVLDSYTGGSTGSFQAFSGTYTATATDAAGGQLAVEVYVEGQGRADNVQLSVEATIPEPSTMGLLALSGLALLRRRRA